MRLQSVRVELGSIVFFLVKRENVRLEGLTLPFGTWGPHKGFVTTLGLKIGGALIWVALNDTYCLLPLFNLEQFWT